MDDDFIIHNVTQMIYEDYEANKTIITDRLGRKVLIYGGPSNIHIKSQLLEL